MNDLEKPCKCGHKWGEHWQRAEGIGRCGVESCSCKRFEDAADTEIKTLHSLLKGWRKRQAESRIYGRVYGDCADQLETAIKETVGRAKPYWPESVTGRMFYNVICELLGVSPAVAEDVKSGKLV